MTQPRKVGEGAEIPGRALGVTLPASEVPEGTFSEMYSESWNITQGQGRI